MNYNEIILLLLLLITMIVLIFHYFINVSDNSKVKEFFEVSKIVGGKNCLETKLDMFDIGLTTKTTYDAFKNNFKDLNFKNYNYHTDYTCESRITPNTQFYGSKNSYTKDISSGDLLLAYNCIEMKPSNIKKHLLSLESGNVFSDTDLLVLLSDKCELTTPDSINIIVRNHLQNTNIGPVYVCISQAPFLADQKGRYDIVSHSNSCYIKPGDEEKYGGACSEKILKCEMLIVKTGGNKKKIKGFVETIQKFKSNNALCKLSCGKNPELGCGCLSQKNVYEGKDFGGNYDSVCLAPDFAHIKQVAHITDYSMVYFVNPYNIKGVTIKSWPLYDYS